ncbi:hypothetical protein J416_11977 [Gracilibacillus halophilus YIM-C55.5]|uniref:ABC-2 type transporter transmembrane domain-containing protein n=1 Tax=Gracilibacillus halophilus YIM-C55.5 TaxID=1308866 RepID=N4WSS5_9BACI|nr:ABC transporter permease [Gracilibacillus halophilus]ENH96221.1 hypothetical protein J416_11977 [Gracilibacillus halophilus YIM-C55.5]
MKAVIITRWLFIKRSMLSFFFWLLLPLVGALLLFAFVDVVEDDSYVPIGVIVEEETELANDLYQEMETSDFVAIRETEHDEAIRQLQQHELDSVFVIHQGYQEGIQTQQRTNLITSYQTNRSYAYTAVKEMIVSHIQEQGGRYQAVQVINQLSERYRGESLWSAEDVIQTSKQIQAEEQLIHASFQYASQAEKKDDEGSRWEIWHIWALLAILSSLLTMDWLIKEKQSFVTQRFYFTKLSWHDYLLLNGFLYFVIWLVIDLVTYVIFSVGFDETMGVVTLLSYRCMLTLLSFCVALVWKRLYVFYAVSFLMACMCGLLLPVRDMHVINWLHPMAAFLDNQITIGWLLCSAGVILFWYGRRRRENAAS